MDYEPIVTAVAAALEAQRSVLITNWLLAVMIVMASVVAAGVILILFRFHEIKDRLEKIEHTLVCCMNKAE